MVSQDLDVLYRPWHVDVLASLFFRDHIDCICNIWHGPEQLGLAGALGDPGFRW